MATRAFFLVSRFAARAPAPLVARNPQSLASRPRSFHSTVPASAADTINDGTSTPVNTAKPSTTPPGVIPAPVAPEYDTKHSAFLGEADSDDAFEAGKEINPPSHEPMDARHAAYLGEADSNDGFDAHRDAHGRPHESMDPKHAAFLGEADSDDAFEAQVAERGDSDHGIIDPTSSAFHGESGEHDREGEPGHGGHA